KARLIIVRPDEEEALAGGCIGIERDDRNARGDCLVDIVFQKIGIGYLHQDTGCLLLDSLIHSIALCFGIKIRRRSEVCPDLELRGSVVETSSCSFPIRYLQIRGYKNKVFVGIVSAAAAQACDR